MLLGYSRACSRAVPAEIGAFVQVACDGVVVCVRYFGAVCAVFDVSRLFWVLCVCVTIKSVTQKDGKTKKDRRR